MAESKSQQQSQLASSEGLPVPAPRPAAKHSSAKKAEAEAHALALASHRVLLFFPQSALSTCRRCHRRFFSAPAAAGAFNSPAQCRHHTELFVRRWHPCETRLDCGAGDGEGYYGGGTEEYAATFWDCCGAESLDAPGCRTARCEGY